MAIKYKVVPWVFDSERFGRHVKAWGDTVGYDTVGEVLGVTPATVKAWGAGRTPGDFNHPRMSNFLKACNELSLDPTEFFRLEE